VSTSIFIWIGFGIFILLMLALDLGVFHRRAHVVALREALAWSAVWIVLALAFNVGVYFWRGPQTALEFLTGYLIEKSLSVDNIFVFLLLFQYFQVPAQYQHRVLFWGILGALVMRAVFILGGIALIHRFHWIIYGFGALLVVSGVRMAFQKDREVHPERNPVLRLLRRWLPISATYEDGRFFVRQAGRWMATPLLVVLVAVETTDLVFAVDSIPAILAITLDPFIVYSSNVFAILGLRALYFALAGVMRLFHYLHYGLSAILVFVGIKMLVSDLVKIPVAVSLSVVAAILTGAVVLSLLRPAPAAVPVDPVARPEADRR
jgi:tellurite resistance protein TerC